MQHTRCYIILYVYIHARCFLAAKLLSSFVAVLTAGCCVGLLSFAYDGLICDPVWTPVGEYSKRTFPTGASWGKAPSQKALPRRLAAEHHSHTQNFSKAPWARLWEKRWLLLPVRLPTRQPIIASVSYRPIEMRANHNAESDQLTKCKQNNSNDREMRFFYSVCY